jgi:hypothetical protein
MSEGVELGADRAEGGSRGITVYPGQIDTIAREAVHKIAMDGCDTVIMLRVREVRTRWCNGSWSTRLTAEGYHMIGNGRGLTSRQILGAVDYACRLLGAEPGRELQRIFEAAT